MKDLKEEYTLCKWCGNPTLMTGTKECDRCYELNTRISANPELALQMLEHTFMEENKL